MARWLILLCLLAVTLLSAPPAAAEMHPGLGRFMQRDPLGYVDGLGLSGYCKDNPLAQRDPAGLFCLVCGVWNKWDGDSATVDSIAPGSSAGSDLLRDGIGALNPDLPLHGGGSYTWRGKDGNWRGYYAFWTFINVCESNGGCGVNVKEAGMLTEYLRNTVVGSSPISYEGATMMKKVKSPMGVGFPCDTWIVVFDAPGSVVTTFGRDRLGWGMIFDRTLQVIESKSKTVLYSRTLHVDFGQLPNGQTGSVSGGPSLSWKN
jgi:hypothetical protein